jgi:hypothetical protein
MTPADFLQSLESVLQHRRVTFTSAAALAFVESCWELIADEPDVWYWSDRFMEQEPLALGPASTAWERG